MTDSLTAPECEAPSAPVGRAMTTAQCRSWLTSHAEGRLGYQSGRGPRHVVVAYVLEGDDIVFRVPDFNEITQYAPGHRVNLTVSGRDGETTRQRVTATGRATLRPDTRAAVLALLPDEPQPGGPSTLVIGVRLETVSGEVVGQHGQADPVPGGPLHPC